MKLHLQQNAKDISYQTSKYKSQVWMQPFDVMIQWEAKKRGGWGVMILNNPKMIAYNQIGGLGFLYFMV